MGAASGQRGAARTAGGEWMGNRGGRPRPDRTGYFLQRFNGCEAGFVYILPASFSCVDDGVLDREPLLEG